VNIALWLSQGLLAALFLATGWLKVFNYEKAKQQAGQDSPPKGLTAFIGLSEMAGAVGLVIPWATGIHPLLTPVAAAALALVMVLAVGHHLLHRHPVSKMIPAVVLLCITALVAWERFEPNTLYGWHKDLPSARHASITEQNARPPLRYLHGRAVAHPQD
jgi:uncharacterized membrane protein YphA (DoxX/SURF4 family)